MDKTRAGDGDRTTPTRSEAQTPQSTGQESGIGAAGLIFRDVLEGLYEGRFVPGQRLVETDLTRIYGVSRSSVREALNRLAAEGIVALHLHRGAQIKALSRNEAEDIVDLLELLMGLAGRLAAKKLKTAGKTSPARRDFLRACEHLLSFEGKPEDYELIRARNRFYNCMIEIGGNAALARMFPAMSVRLIRVQFRAFQAPSPVRFARYRQISEAVLAGDPIRAERAGRRHVSHLRTMLQNLPASAFAPD